MLQKITGYLSLVKFSHTVFALPFAAIGFTIGLVHADFNVAWTLGIKVLLCMVFARNAAMAFNRWADKEFDALNPRTAVRELPSGKISSSNALLFTFINCILFIVTTWFINPLCFYLSFVALLCILGYSYTKRFTALCHLFLGTGLSLAPLGAYLAVTASFSLLPVLIALAVLCWVSGFDIIYALQDKDFDQANRLHSIPALLGARNALIVSRFLHLCCITFLALACTYNEFGLLYAAGLLVFALLLIFQHSLVRENDLTRVNLAFFTTNGIASVVFSIFTVTSLLI